MFHSLGLSPIVSLPRRGLILLQVIWLSPKPRVDSALLLVVWNCRQMTYSRRSPSSDCSTIPTPPACCVDEPFTWTTHCFIPWSPLCCSQVGVNLVMKSAKAWAFIASLGQCHTSSGFQLIHNLFEWVIC